MFLLCFHLYVHHVHLSLDKMLCGSEINKL
jgi:hypothetical protein